MIRSKPISTPRTVWLIARLALRRQLNVWQTARFGRKKNVVAAPNMANGAMRSGTAGGDWLPG